ncbi:MAG: PIN domain-containing protein [Bryobacteraceae bacterium]|nr:PIN domain-containing protein [Bryobacteraceae bacterium]
MTYVDSSALFALIVAEDASHKAALGAWNEFEDAGEELIFTNYVVSELLALLQRRSGMDAARAAVTRVLPAIRLEWIEPQDHTSAIQALLAANRRKLSLVDVSSFVVMRRLGIERAFAFDEHFAEQGFETVPASTGA